MGNRLRVDGMRGVDRRTFLRRLGGGAAAAAALPASLDAALPKAKITRVRIYKPEQFNPTFNQSNMVVTVETDIGMTGVGEGGTKDMIEQCAGSLIGQDPFRSEHIWHEMFKGWFYPPGREKIHAQGALDLALWDLKGKALDVPVHALLGGTMRNHLECYGTGPLRTPGASAAGGGQGQRMTLRDRAKATIDSGFRAFRMGAGRGEAGDTYNTRQQVRETAQMCKEVREGVGPGGDWLIDFHQRFDFADALRACRAIEEYEPYFVEDPVADAQAMADIPKLRMMTSVPLTHGEEWGHRWDFYKLVENKDIDYIRATLPNVGGITEMLKIAALCQTHAVGIAPHFTGPIATAAIVHVLGPFSGPVIVEIGSNTSLQRHISEGLDFKEGKCWPNQRPGLGVKLNTAHMTQIGEVTQPGNKLFYFRPDGSLTHW
jgi:L-alanine-DL-glutamate epimerase-like enolase superfamily enzyme